MCRLSNLFSLSATRIIRGVISPGCTSLAFVVHVYSFMLRLLCLRSAAVSGLLRGEEIRFGRSGSGDPEWPIGCFTALAVVAEATNEIPIGLGITSPYIRHPTVQASECAGIDELSGGRFTMGLGVGKVGIEYLEYDIDVMKPVPVHQEALDIMRKVFTGEAYDYEGKFYKSSMPGYDRAADGLRTEIPI